FQMADALTVEKYVSEKAIAATTLNIPHPYTLEMAEEWIGTHKEAFENGQAVRFAITLEDSGELVGAIGLEITAAHERAEIGYWIGKPHWGKGYCTEAAIAVIQHGFDSLGLERIFATHFLKNPASGRIMQKAGMKHEGRLRHHIKKWGEFEHLEMYSILRSNTEDNH
ncbi:MAG: GNAT family N-acetyltransferase, partial [Chloroflexota bacterium]|nr:GNAT family N-acetyltransferase [Chloroflexota bacterium]